MPPNLTEWIAARSGCLPKPWQVELWEQWSHAGPTAVWHPGSPWSEPEILDVLVLWLAHQLGSGPFRHLVWATGRRGGERPMFLAARRLARQLHMAREAENPLGEVARMFLAAAQKAGRETPLVVIDEPGCAVAPHPALPPGCPGILTLDLQDVFRHLLWASPADRLAPLQTASLLGDSLLILVDTIVPLAAHQTLGRLQAVLADEPTALSLHWTWLSRYRGISTGLPAPSVPLPECSLELCPTTDSKFVPTLVDLAEMWRQQEVQTGVMVVNHPADAVNLARTLVHTPWDITVVTGQEMKTLMDDQWQKLMSPPPAEQHCPRLLVLTGVADVTSVPSGDRLALEVASWDSLVHRLGQWTGQGPVTIIAKKQMGSNPAGTVWQKLCSATGKEPIADATRWHHVCRLAQQELETEPPECPGWAPEGFRSAPPLTSGRLDLAVQTFPRPHPQPFISPLVWGSVHSEDEIGLVWRPELDLAPPAIWGQLVRLLPPAPDEICRVTLSQLWATLRSRRWQWSPLRTEGTAGQSRATPTLPSDMAAVIWKASGEIILHGLPNPMGEKNNTRLEHGDTLLLPLSSCPSGFFSGVSPHTSVDVTRDRALESAGWLVLSIGPHLPGMKDFPWQRWWNIWDQQRLTPSRIRSLLSRLASYLAGLGTAAAEMARRLQAGLDSGTPPAIWRHPHRLQGWIVFPWAMSLPPEAGDWLPQMVHWRGGWPVGSHPVTIESLKNTLLSSLPGLSCRFPKLPPEVAATWEKALHLAATLLAQVWQHPVFQEQTQALERHFRLQTGCLPEIPGHLIHPGAPRISRQGGWIITWDPSAPDWEACAAIPELTAFVSTAWECMLSSPSDVTDTDHTDTDHEAMDLAIYLVSVLFGAGRPLPARPGVKPVHTENIQTWYDMAIQTHPPRCQNLSPLNYAGRFWRIQKRWGRWGVSWLESLWRWWVWEQTRKLAGAARLNISDAMPGETHPG